MAKEHKTVNKRIRDSCFCLVAIISVTFGSEISRYLDILISTAHSHLQTVWDSIILLTGDDPFVLYIYGSIAVTGIFYWGISLVILAMDLRKKPTWLSQYKVNPEANCSLNKQQIFQVVTQVLFNQTFVGVPFALAAYYWFLPIFYPLPPVHTLPSFGQMLFDLLICLITDEVCFYYIHRLLHHRYLYKYVHKRHHEWTTPIAIAAAYCHPLEYLFGNLIPIFTGLVLTGPHIFEIWIWIVIVVMITCNDHGGYHFPFALSQEFHYFHHAQFNNCFGLFGIMDYLHGTDKAFRASAAFKRHFVSFTTRPLSQIYPNEKVPSSN